MGQYQDALIREIKHFSKQCTQKQLLDTVYLGGGTPSTYPDALILDTFDTLKSIFTFSKGIEATIEVNPGTVRPEQLTLWKEIGINRISVGVQSLNNEVLKKLNRHQDARDVFSLLDHASPLFNNISVDIILGLPGVSTQEWKSLLKQLVTWPIQHVSMYFLMVHENTPLFFKVKKEQVTLPCDDAMVELYYWSRDYLATHGFEQYELSSFAKPGFESKHNTVYWDRKPYKGFGIGACSFDGQKRFQNEKNLMKYMKNVKEDKSVITCAELLTSEQIRLEHLMLGLRRSQGVHRETILDGLTASQQAEMLKRLQKLEEKKYLSQTDGRLFLTPKGLVVENEVVTNLWL